VGKISKSVSLKTCTACKKVMYCSKECQVRDWPYHKKDCNKLKQGKMIYTHPTREFEITNIGRDAPQQDIATLEGEMDEMVLIRYMPTNTFWLSGPIHPFFNQ